jgi:hypothetical protein
VQHLDDRESRLVGQCMEELSRSRNVGGCGHVR